MADLPDGASRLIADRRRGFCYQTHDALDAIRACVEVAEKKLKLSTALAVYLVLTETANRAGGEQARNGFRASRASLARAVGCSVDTFDRYVAEFVEIALLVIERERDESGNLPNLWVLLDAPSRTETAGGSRTGSARGSRTGSAHELQEEDLDQEPPTSPPLPAKVDRVSVSESEGRLAVEVLAAYNELTGQSFAGKDWLSKIVMRIREHPDLDLEAHQLVLEVAFRDPWWKGRPAPSVVYGNAALFEKCLDAARAAPLRAGDGQPRQGTKFGRRDVSAGELLALADQLERREEIESATG